MNIYVVTGQTATGKTAYALELAAKYNGELVNCDSRQVYKKLDIITGKDVTGKFKLVHKINNFEIGYYKMVSLFHGSMAQGNKVTMKQSNNIPIWLYDVVDPKQPFSSFDYVQYAQYVMSDIIKRGKIPIIVGGTGYYLNHLIHGLPENKVEPDWKLRTKLETKSVEELQKMFKKLSIQSFNRLNNSDRLNPRRLIRRIELAQSKTIRLFEYSNNHMNTKSAKFIVTGFAYADIQSLTTAITNRVEKRLMEGAIDEVKKLLKQGYSESDPGLYTIGYQQIIKFLKGSITKQQAVDSWIMKERQYAKRQLTYLKKYFPGITWKYI